MLRTTGPRRPQRCASRMAAVIGCLAVLAGLGAGLGVSAAQASPAARPAPSAAGAIPLPRRDPFYRYHGHRPLRSIAPGTVLRHRSVTLGTAGTGSTPLPAEQLLYRTQDQRGRPSVTVTTVVNPTGRLSTGIVAYLSFYDALGDVCDPSYTLRGGDAGTSSNNSQAQTEAALVTSLVAQGYAVTVPDFEGEDLHWVAGQESGRSTLDAVRATEHYLGSAPGTKVGLFGYSGGSIAGEWAAELAPRYSPGLDIVGTAIGGIPVDLAHNLRYVNGSKDWSGVIPAVLVSLGRAFGLDVARYESPYGARLTHAVSDQCIGSFNGAYPGLTVQRLLEHRYRHFLKVPAFARIVNRLTMGTTPGHPRMPMLMTVGNADGTGDGVMIARDVEALAHEYCQQGVPVQFTVARGSDHTQAGLRFFPEAFAFLAQRFLGTPFTGNCSSVGRGNSLAPLPVGHGHRHHHPHGRE